MREGNVGPARVMCAGHAWNVAKIDGERVVGVCDFSANTGFKCGR